MDAKGFWRSFRNSAVGSSALFGGLSSRARSTEAARVNCSMATSFLPTPLPSCCLGLAVSLLGGVATINAGAIRARGRGRSSRADGRLVVQSGGVTIRDGSKSKGESVGSWVSTREGARDLKSVGW